MSAKPRSLRPTRRTRTCPARTPPSACGCAFRNAVPGATKSRQPHFALSFSTTAGVGARSSGRAVRRYFRFV
ncbi:hypothetical protein [Lysobacter gummosus]|uniref:hypothetical protein n=1 Tax=Lysobacter gummosus TaxID=262324 RepID=UPI00362FBDFE